MTWWWRIILNRDKPGGDFFDMAKQKLYPDITYHPQWKEFAARYANDFIRYQIEICGMKPTHQQIEVSLAMQKPRCRVSGSSGHSTGKSRLFAAYCDWFLRVYAFSNMILTANNIEQVRSVVWKELDDLKRGIDSRFPWMRPYFIKETKRYYAKGLKDSWFVLPRTAAKHNPESMAGMHRKWYSVLVDEASGVDDTILSTLRGGLTGENDRLVMFSQPTKSTGFFARTITDKTLGYDVFHMDSELSPLVDKKWIAEKAVEYGGFLSPEYQIKVKGLLPSVMSGMLIPRQWAEDSKYFKIEHNEPWGYVALCDVGDGVYRDKSVLNVCKISGTDPLTTRRVEPVLLWVSNSYDPKKFAKGIHERIHNLPDITVVVESIGPGRTVELDLREMNYSVQSINWGLPPHTKNLRRRFKNLRAYASYCAREALFEERMKLPGIEIPGVTDEASKIPYKINDKGQYLIMAKDEMRTKGISSPDLFDTFCFAYLARFIPCEDFMDDAMDRLDKKNKTDDGFDHMAWAKKILGDNNEE